MAFFNNGILIQDTDREYKEFTEQGNFTYEEFKNFRAYRGLGRYYRSWPLSIENDILSKQLTAETEKWFVTYYPDKTPEFNFEFVPERQFFIKYVRHCRTKGIRIRILFCLSESEKPLWDSPLPKLNFLGYDYCTLIPYHSPIPEDLLTLEKEHLNHPLYKALIKCCEKLNRNKLFDNEKDIKTYIEKRKEVIESDVQWSKTIIGGREFLVPLLDHDYDFRIIQLAEVVGDL